MQRRVKEGTQPGFHRDTDIAVTAVTPGGQNNSIYVSIYLPIPISVSVSLNLSIFLQMIHLYRQDSSAGVILNPLPSVPGQAHDAKMQRMFEDDGSLMMIHGQHRRTGNLQRIVKADYRLLDRTSLLKLRYRQTGQMVAPS